MERKDLFRIGQVSRLFGLSISALRFYEARGLLTPEYTDPVTGYRYYSTRQFECLNTIRYLRLLDTPLDDIAEFLASRDLDRIRILLRQQQSRIEEKQHNLEILRQKVDNRLRQLEDAASSHPGEISLGPVPPRRLASVPGPLTITSDGLDLEPSIRQLESRQPEAMIFLGKIGVGINPERLLRGEYSVYDHVYLLLDPEEDYLGEVVHVPEQTCLTVRFVGTHVQAAPWYARLMKRVSQERLTPSGPSLEVTLIDQGLTDNPDLYITEIRIPVEPAGQP